MIDKIKEIIVLETEFYFYSVAAIGFLFIIFCNGYLYLFGIFSLALCVIVLIAYLLYRMMLVIKFVDDSK